MKGRIAVSASFAAALAAGMAISLPGCGSPDREEQLRETIAAMAASLEEHRPDGFMDHVAQDFSGDRGAWDHARVRRFVAGHSLRRESVNIGLGGIEITLHGERATAVVEATISGEGNWFPGGGETYRFETGWRMQSGDWRIIRADWKRVR